ncbi:hypothetical protein TELCIR_19200, partial [Teladorsagia circumcincta]
NEDFAEPVCDILSIDNPFRYSILSQHLPLKVTTTPSTPDEDEGPQFMYLEAPPIDCYCDESCTALGDCCSDYTYVCPRRDCRVSGWAEWEPCVPDEGSCGTDITTVALLIDYRFNDTRSKMARDNIYWDLPSVREKLKQAT